VLTTIDVGAFAGLCESWAQFREASEFLHKHGAVYKTPKGGLMRAPQVALARDALAAYMRGCAEFGLTAAARTRVRVHPAGEDDEDDLLDKPSSAKA
jgi:P27 family predicted phage terminase small subunit